MSAALMTATSYSSAEEEEENNNTADGLSSQRGRVMAVAAAAAGATTTTDWHDENHHPNDDDKKDHDNDVELQQQQQQQQPLLLADLLEEMKALRNELEQERADRAVMKKETEDLKEQVDKLLLQQEKTALLTTSNLNVNHHVVHQEKEEEEEEIALEEGFNNDISKAAADDATDLELTDTEFLTDGEFTEIIASRRASVESMITLPGNDNENNNQQLDYDTYSFLITAGYWTYAFVFGVFVSFIQLTTTLLLLLNLEFPKAVPPNVDNIVRATQCIAILLIASIQDDIMVAFIRFGEGFQPNTVGRVFINSTPFKWYGSNALRLLEGLLVVGASFCLIVQSDNIKDLLLNFTAVSFLSQLDDAAFAIASHGFLGYQIKQDAVEVQQKTYDGRKDWKKYRDYVNRLLFGLILLAMFGGWIYFTHGQMTEKYLCHTVYVQFGDDVATPFSSHSGLYDLERPFLQDNDRRVLYRERRSRTVEPHDDNNFGHHVGGGVVGYCQADNTWNFVRGDGGQVNNGKAADFCNNWDAKSAYTKTYDFEESLLSPWNARGSVGDTVVPMDSFRVVCLDEDNDNDLICEDEVDCPCEGTETFGLFCDTTNPCATIVSVATGGTSIETTYHILTRTSSSDSTSLMVYNHPVYINRDSDAVSEMMFFTGTHWVQTSADRIDSLLGGNHTYAAVLDFFSRVVFHAAMLPNAAVMRVSEGTDGLSYPTPLGLRWFAPLYSSSDQIGLPMMDRSKPEDFSLSCAYCNDKSNPCYYEGICGPDGKCTCQHGASGKLCEIVPAGDGHCDTYFNTKEHNFDGGDCCGLSCNLNEDNTEFCGAGGLNSSFGVDFLTISDRAIGFPNCKEPDMLPISVYLQSTYSRRLGVKLDCDGIVYLYIPPEAMDSFADGSETVWVKDGTNCHMQFELSESFYDVYSSSTVLEFEAKVQQMPQSRNLVEMKSSLSSQRYTTSTPFAVLKECYYDAISDLFETGMLVYVSRLQGESQSLAINATKSQGKALDWMNRDPSEWSSCSRNHSMLEQRHALATLSYASNGTLSGDGTWCSPYDECTWSPGVVCNEDGGTLQLNLVNYKLGTSIPQEIAVLSHLEILDLTSTGIIGGIPTALSQLTDLVTLKLPMNELTGTIPSELPLNLRLLDFEGNRLTGEIPASINALTKLTSLSFYRNALSGTLASELGALSMLEFLSIASNKFRGPLPDELWALTNLQTLRLFRNRFAGTLSSRIGMLSNLQNVYIFTNEFSGGIPGSVANLVNVTKFEIFENSFNGTIPVELATLTNLESLWLGDNNLFGNMPSQLGKLTNMTRLLLHNNRLERRIPTELGLLTELDRLVLHTNKFTGTLASELGKLSQLTRLYLNGNGFTGTLPSELGQLNQSERLYLYENSLTGTVPWELSKANALGRLFLYSNNLSGSLPSAITSLPNLETMLLHNTSMSGTIEDETCSSFESPRTFIVDCDNINCASNCDCRGRYFPCDSTINNDGINQTKRSCMDGYVALRIHVLPDIHPQQITWELLTTTSSNNQTKQLMLSGNASTSNEFKDDILDQCVQFNDTCYNFTINDLNPLGVTRNRKMGFRENIGFGAYSVYIDDQIVGYGGELTESGLETFEFGGSC